MTLKRTKKVCQFFGTTLFVATTQ